MSAPVAVRKRVVFNTPEQVQTLALDGYNTEFAQHLVLQVVDRPKACRFIGGLLRGGWIRFDRRGSPGATGTNIGFSYAGLQALGLDATVLATLAAKSPAFAAGAPLRASTRLGDAGPSAVDRWDEAFGLEVAHLWLALHENEEAALDRRIAELRNLEGASGLAGWDRPAPRAEHLVHGQGGVPPEVRTVHFGYRDGITRPTIFEQPYPRADHAAPARQREEGEVHAPGELLLGFPNDTRFNFWDDPDTPPSSADFLRCGSFGVLRQIEQDVAGFESWLSEQSARFVAGNPAISVEFLKAKVCGRWPNGALVRPGDTQAPDLRQHPDRLVVNRPTHGDEHGEGCPFGAHIRRANPRKDPVLPPGRKRVLFRRGMPYGPEFHQQEAAAGSRPERGLMGVFFCSRIEDQFEVPISEWIEKMPMGLPEAGNAKDPLTGNHDGRATNFRIPLAGGADIRLNHLRSFTQTRGTLYALFPSRAALEEIASRGSLPASRAAAGRGTAAQGPTAQGGSSGAAHAQAVQPHAMDAPVDRYCDIVMEGGITSGIVYPPAVFELSRYYRFQSISGSSIGAFAAALTAAAEWRRRHGSNAGFDEVKKVPDTLAQKLGNSQRTLLERLFNPQPRTERLFKVFAAGLGKTSWMRVAAASTGAAIWQYGAQIAIVGTLLSVMLLWGPFLYCWRCLVAGLLNWAAALVFVWLVALVVGPLIGMAFDLGRGLVGNGFGLCRGWGEQPGDGIPDLCGFLHASIQKIAGRDPERDAPLTFRELWEAPGAPADVLHFGGRISGAPARSIDLQVYATNLAQGRPYRFPLDDPRDPECNEDMGRLFFRPSELRAYFPEGLVQAMVAVGRRYEPLSASDPPASVETHDVIELAAGDLPVVVAVRMAMSFPGLISAVPLHAIDYLDRRGSRQLKPCWMSDGGLCSNFPIHLFDSWLPAWPTFGIALLTRGKDSSLPPVWLPGMHREGRADLFDNSMAQGHSAFARLGSFVMRIAMSAWRWNDRTLMRMPGVRDRVVRVFLRPNEGGINFRMSGQAILDLARTYGKPAAEAFIDRFTRPGATGWDEHRWVRLGVLVEALRERVAGIRRGARMDRHAEPLSQQIHAARSCAPLAGAPESGALPSEEPINDDQAAELTQLLAALEKLESTFAIAPDAKPYIPMPRARLRMRYPA